VKPATAIVIASLLLSASVLAQTPGPEGEQFQINTYTTGYQFSTEAAADPAGGLKVVWSSRASRPAPATGFSISARNAAQGVATLRPKGASHGEVSTGSAVRSTTKEPCW